LELTAWLAPTGSSERTAFTPSRVLLAQTESLGQMA